MDDAFGVLVRQKIPKPCRFAPGAGRIDCCEINGPGEVFDRFRPVR